MNLSVVIPAFNEERRLGDTLEEIRLFMERNGYEYEVIVVDDGSSDDTVKVAQVSRLAKASRLELVSNERNRGKGYSVREGLGKARGDLVLITDADLSTPIRDLHKLMGALKAGGDVAIGSRSIPGADVQVSQPFYRVLMGKIFNLFVRSFVMGGLIDTQCGFKLIKKECINDIIGHMRLDGFTYDVEMLYLASKKGYRIKEVPVVWRDSAGSKVDPLKDPVKMFMDLLNIKKEHRNLK
jgi:dolichyl-phosphate beta-glucosyltransferase